MTWPRDVLSGQKWVTKMNDSQYLEIWRLARKFRKDYPYKETIRIKSAPYGTAFFGLFSDYVPTAFIERDPSPKIAVELFVKEYNRRHKQKMTIKEFLGDDFDGK